MGFLAFGPLRPGEPTFGGMTRTQVRANADQYMAGSLESELAEQFRIHLQLCPSCQKYWREMSGTPMEGTHVGFFRHRELYESSHCRPKAIEDELVPRQLVAATL